jgi:hypothetical protein
MRTRALLAGLLVTAALAAAGTAAANQLRPNAGDQAAAKRAVLKASDLPQIGKWQAEKPAATTSGAGGGAVSAHCADYAPKSADLVTTGDAKSEFAVPGLDILNDVEVLSTPRMVELDWKRTMVNALLPCLGKAFTHGAGGKVKVVSLRKVQAPAVGTYSATYRLVFSLTVQGKPVRGLADFVALAGGRVEVTFLVVAAIGSQAHQAQGEADLSAIDKVLAQTVGARVFAPTA